MEAKMQFGAWHLALKGEILRNYENSSKHLTHVVLMNTTKLWFIKIKQER